MPSPTQTGMPADLPGDPTQSTRQSHGLDFLHPLLYSVLADLP